MENLAGQKVKTRGALVKTPKARGVIIRSIRPQEPSSTPSLALSRAFSLARSLAPGTAAEDTGAAEELI